MIIYIDPKNQLIQYIVPSGLITKEKATIYPGLKSPGYFYLILSESALYVILFLCFLNTTKHPEVNHFYLKCYYT